MDEYLAIGEALPRGSLQTQPNDEAEKQEKRSGSAGLCS